MLLNIYNEPIDLWNQTVKMVNEKFCAYGRKKDLQTLNSNECNRINKIIRTKIRQAKKFWLQQQWQELERLQGNHDDFKLHKKFKETFGAQNKIDSHILVNDRNQTIYEIDYQRQMPRKLSGRNI